MDDAALCGTGGTLRAKLTSIVQYGHGRIGHAFQFGLATILVLSMGLLPLEFLPNASLYRDTIYIIEGILVVIFLIEYVLRVYTAPSRLAYIFSFFGILDLLCLLPFFFGMAGVESLRALRLLRFARLGEVEPSGKVQCGDAIEMGLQLLDGERVELTILKHGLFLFLGCIPSAVAFGFAFAIWLVDPANVMNIVIALLLFAFGMLLLWKNWLDFSYDVIYVTTHRIIFQNKHILGRSINQINYAAIANVKPFYPSIVAYLFRYGSLIIDTAAESPGQIRMDMVRHHEEAAHMIMQKSTAMQR